MRQKICQYLCSFYMQTCSWSPPFVGRFQLGPTQTRYRRGELLPATRHGLHERNVAPYSRNPESCQLALWPRSEQQPCRLNRWWTQNWCFHKPELPHTLHRQLPKAGSFCRFCRGVTHNILNSTQSTRNSLPSRTNMAVTGRGVIWSHMKTVFHERRVHERCSNSEIVSSFFA